MGDATPQRGDSQPSIQDKSECVPYFGVNKSGEFFGYAKYVVFVPCMRWNLFLTLFPRMAGGIGKSQERISWASRTDSSHSHSPTTSLSSSNAGRARVEDSIPEENEEGVTLRRTPGGRKGGLVFSPGENRLAEDSPQPLTDQEQARMDDDLRVPDAGSSRQVSGNRHHPAVPGHLISAPAEMHQPHRKVSLPTPLAPHETIAIDPSGCDVLWSWIQRLPCAPCVTNKSADQPRLNR